MLIALSVGDSVQEGLDAFFAFLPNLIGALIILLIGWLLAKLAKRVLTTVLRSAGLDRALEDGDSGKMLDKVGIDSPSRLAGKIAYWFILIGALSVAIPALGIEALESFVASIYSYLPNVVAALVIFVVAGAVAAAVAALVERTMGDTPTGTVVKTGVPVVVMAIATFMILEQLEIAPEIVRITYAMLLGSVALGLALAFGLGGRDVAGRLLEQAYESGQENKEQVKQDLREGKQQAREDAEQARDRAEDEMDDSGQGGSSRF